ncbi:MAG: hypothetical protein WCP96_17330, partial [Methylococcaceae bacterium]
SHFFQQIEAALLPAAIPYAPEGYLSQGSCTCYSPSTSLLNLLCCFRKYNNFSIYAQLSHAKNAKLSRNKNGLLNHVILKTGCRLLSFNIPTPIQRD